MRESVDVGPVIPVDKRGDSSATGPTFTEKRGFRDGRARRDTYGRKTRV